MRYAKLIDGRPVYAPTRILHGGNYICNPTADVLEEEGYKPVRFTEAPTTEPGFVAVPHWEETEVMGDAVIAQIWIVEPEPDEIPEDRAYRIITGEEE